MTIEEIRKNTTKRINDMTSAIYIPKGKIVPNWILRFENKKQEKYKIKSNGFYVVRHKEGALYMYPEADHSYLIIGSNLKNVNITTAPYSKYGSAMFYCKEKAMEALNNPVIDSRGKTIE